MSRKKSIPNPNKITKEELSFIQSSLNDNIEIISNISEDKEKFKGRMISMSDSFFNQLNQYLKENPTEGNRSNFIVRIIAGYIKEKNSK